MLTDYQGTNIPCRTLQLNLVAHFCGQKKMLALALVVAIEIATALAFLFSS